MITAPTTRPPEGQLLADARHRRVPKLSAEQAAALAGMSENRWLQIETGRGPGGRRVVADETRLAIMAHAVGVDPEELRAVGRGDAADVYERLWPADVVEYRGLRMRLADGLGRAEADRLRASFRTFVDEHLPRT